MIVLYVNIFTPQIKGMHEEKCTMYLAMPHTRDTTKYTLVYIQMWHSKLCTSILDFDLNYKFFDSFKLCYS